MSKYRIEQSSDRQFYFNLIAANGERILTSELYTTRGSARDGIGAVRENAGIDAQYERPTSQRGEAYFVLKAGNGEMIGTSEMYSSPGARDAGIGAVKRERMGAAVVD